MSTHSVFFTVLLLIYSCSVHQCVSTWFVRSGEPVRERTEFPFLALMITDQSMCTATLVSTKAIITAGHCVCGPKSIRRISFLTLSDFDKRSINYEPSSIKVPPEYDPVCQLKRANQRVTQTFGGYDVAVVTLSEMVDLGDGVKVVSMASESEIPVPNTVVHIVGYGKDVRASDDTARYGGVLKKGRAVVMECLHKTVGNPICIKPDPISQQIIGPGDSGGPLLLTPQGPIIGVASGGVFLPAIGDLCVEYASVSRSLGFIMSNI
ncbi:unnamed protein product [Heterobilharzia americana]|nr:unnamed protein product [Heterobilharzia americana]CAH8579328.1 unnamed protein product [Heterobilharzia americana]CAH8608337.1 unnamed protein product [Heterobilharzia americana]